MTIMLISFSYRLGIPPCVDVPVDCRAMNNPHNLPRLKILTGLSSEVQNYVSSDRLFEELIDDGQSVAKSGKTLGFGCIGGRHRSPAMAELLAKQLRDQGHRVEVQHWGINTELYLQQSRKSATI